MCALDEVQVTFACIGHPSGTTVTIIIQVCLASTLLPTSLAEQRCLSRLQTCKGRKICEVFNWWCHSTPLRQHRELSFLLLPAVHVQQWLCLR